MSRKKPRTSQPAVFNSIRFYPANFGEIGSVGDDVDGLISLCALDCALNQGLATGVTLMNEKVMALPLATLQNAEPPRRQHPWWSKVNHPGRLRPRPLLVEHPTEPGQYILVAGAVLVHEAAVEGATHVDCVVVPYDLAMAIGRALIDGFACPRNGWKTVAETMPAYESATQPDKGKDHSERLDGIETPPKKRSSTATPAVSHSGISQGLDPNANLLLASAVHTATVEEDGEVIVRANSIVDNTAVQTMLSHGDQKGLDIVIKRTTLEAGKAGMSLHELAVTFFLGQLFKSVENTTTVKDRRRSGHSLAQDKRGTDLWVGSPRSFQNWVEARKDLFASSKEFWNKAIPDALFKRCVALRYGVAEPTSSQLDAYLFKLIQVAFKALELAERQTSNLRKLHEINHRSKQRVGQEERRRIINEAVDGISDPLMGERYQVNEVDRFMLAVLGRVNSAKIWRDKAHQTLMYQWLAAIGDLARTDKMIVTCLMAQEFVLVERERKAQRSIDAGWMVFDATLPLAVKERCSWNKAYRELVLLCQQAMRGSRGMIVSRTAWGPATLVSEHLTPSASIAAEAPILLF